MKTRHIARMALRLSAVVLLATSCSVRHIHTAKSLSIESAVTQMPTVTELDVAPQQIKADTAWVNHLFKGTTSLKTQEKELIAQMLSEANADILVEPKIAHESRRHWFRSNHQLSVSGYPARYKQFRTATKDDIETINALRYPENARPTVILAQSAQPATRLAPKGARVTRIAQAVRNRRMKERKPYQRKSGYRGFLEAGYLNFCTSDDYEGDGFAVATIQGIQINPHLFAGVGAGYYSSYNMDAKHPDYYNGYNDENYADMLPVFGNVKAYLLKSRFSPYIDLRGGYDFCNTESYFVSGGIGFSFGHLDIGANYFKFKPFSGIQARIGFSF